MTRHLSVLLSICFGFAFLIIGGTPVAVAKSDKTTILVLDASGSMWGQLEGGKTKIEIAREVLGDFFALRDPSVPLGVIGYGHNRKGDCTDIEVIASAGVQESSALSDRLNRINPKGKTPLAQALRLAASEIPITSEEADIVLVTDGLETCDLDPCAVADELASDGVKIRAHVVGFGLTEAEADTLACVADKTGGLLMRPQSGAELADALLRTSVADQPATAVGVRLIFSYGGGMPETYRWSLRINPTGEETVLADVSGDARYDPFPIELDGGWYTAMVTAENGSGKQDFEVVPGQAQDVTVKMIGNLPVAIMRNKGPFAAVGQTLLIEVDVTAEGQESGGAAMTLNLYQRNADGSQGDSITYATVDGRVGPRGAGLNIPGPGQYVLNLETWVGDILQTMTIDAEIDPTVTISAPPTVEPGQAIPVETRGSQLQYDTIEVWQGDIQINSGLYLSDIALGQKIKAPTEPGTYDLVYRGYDAGGEIVEKARTAIEVGAVTDDASGDIATSLLEAHSYSDDDMTHAPDGPGPDGVAWEDHAYHCLNGGWCEVKDPDTNLSFVLPELWVATKPSLTPMTAGAANAGALLDQPYVEFYDSTGNKRMIVLNPHQWLDSNGFCEWTRAGDLCMFLYGDRQPPTEEAYDDFRLLQDTLTTGEVDANCGPKADCPIVRYNPEYSVTIPRGWVAETLVPGPEGKLTGWYVDRDPGGNLKMIGLNQPGGQLCEPTALGELCYFSSYIATHEFNLIRDTLSPSARPNANAAPADGLGSATELTDSEFNSVFSIIEGQ